MLKQSRNKLTEEMLKVQALAVDKEFLLQELLEMQDSIQSIIDDLNTIELNDTYAYVLSQLCDVSNISIAKINNILLDILESGV